MEGFKCCVVTGIQLKSESRDIVGRADVRACFMQESSGGCLRNVTAAFFFYVLEASGKGTNLESLVGELGFGQSELMDSLKNASCSLFFKLSPSSRSYKGGGGARLDHPNNADVHLAKCGIILQIKILFDRNFISNCLIKKKKVNLISFREKIYVKPKRKNSPWVQHFLSWWILIRNKWKKMLWLRKTMTQDQFWVFFP